MINHKQHLSLVKHLTRARPLRAARRNTLNLNQALDAVRLCNSYSMLGAVVGLYDLMPHYGEWLQLLGKKWCGCDNIFEYQNKLRKLLPDTTTPQMMTAAEILTLAKLPEIVTVYRGADFQRNVVGLSWSLDLSMARRFPTFNRYRAREPVLITAKVRRQQIIAYKLDCGESEVITKNVEVHTIESLLAVA